MDKDYTSDKIQMQREEFQAFVLFLNEGMIAVERMFPQHREFVERNAGRPYREVQEQLNREEKSFFLSKHKRQAVLNSDFFNRPEVIE